MKRRNFLALIIFTVALLPSLATAAVIMNNPVSVNTSATQGNPVFLAEGPGYSVANELGYISLIGDGAHVNGGETLYMNGTPGTGNTVLNNVLEIVNGSSSNFHGAVTIYLNGTLPTGVEIFYSEGEMSYNGYSVVGGQQLTTGLPIHLTSQKLYITVVLEGNLATSYNDVMTLQTVYS